MGKNLKGKELGEGLSQRKDGRYMARYKGKCRYAETEKEARTVYRQLVQDVESHAYVNKSALTLAEYFEEWLAGRSDIKGSSKTNYKAWFKWLSEVMGKEKLQQIEKADVLVATAGTQEIRIGKEIILKTEYLEFEEAVVTSVEYPSADSAQ